MRLYKLLTSAAVAMALALSFGPLAKAATPTARCEPATGDFEFIKSVVGMDAAFEIDLSYGNGSDTTVTFTATMNDNIFFAPGVFAQRTLSAGLGAHENRLLTPSRLPAGRDQVVIKVTSDATGRTVLATCAFTLAVLSDFDGDGRPDVIVRRRQDGSLWLFRGTVGGNLLPGYPFDWGWNAFVEIVAPGDFNSDGRSDLLARDAQGGLWFYRGTGQGGLVQEPGILIDSGWNIYSYLVTPGDFDRDGKPDLIGVKRDGTLWFYKGTGAGRLERSPGLLIDSGWDIFQEIFSPGDFDRDGTADLLARKPDGTLWFYKGSGQGGLVQEPPKLIDSGWQRFVRLAGVGDLDGDGAPDILAQRDDGTLWLYRGTGEGTFIQEPGMQVGRGWEGFDILLGVGVW